MISLQRRAQASKSLALLSPILAVALTVAVSGVIFALRGLDPSEALFVYFVEPLASVWSLEELAVKSAPLILIGIGNSGDGKDLGINVPVFPLVPDLTAPETLAFQGSPKRLVLRRIHGDRWV